jgi:hypothetical protein
MQYNPGHNLFQKIQKVPAGQEGTGRGRWPSMALINFRLELDDETFKQNCPGLVGLHHPGS